MSSVMIRSAIFSSLVSPVSEALNDARASVLAQDMSRSVIHQQRRASAAGFLDQLAEGILNVVDDAAEDRGFVHAAALVKRVGVAGVRQSIASGVVASLYARSNRD
jgi:hypothetical protein